MDTNILVSAYFWDGNEKGVVSRCCSKDFRSITSPEILEELEHVLISKFREPMLLVVGFLEEMILMSDIVHPEGTIDVIDDDPSDNWVLETALLGEADIIVSGDKHLLTLGSYEGVRILRARDL